MKLAVLGTLLGVGLVAAAGGTLEQGGKVLPPQRDPAGVVHGAGGELIVVPFGLPEKGLMLSVIDPHRRVMSVYHLDPGTGKIALKSVRDFHWDLQMTDFNNEAPLPQEIQSLLEQR